MASRHNIAAAVALVLLSLFPLATFQYSAADDNQDAVAPVYDVIAAWPSAPRGVAFQLIDTYGVPDEISTEALVWHRREPWEHTLVYRVDSAAPHTETVSTPRVETTTHASPQSDFTQR